MITQLKKSNLKIIWSKLNSKPSTLPVSKDIWNVYEDFTRKLIFPLERDNIAPILWYRRYLCLYPRLPINNRCERPRALFLLSSQAIKLVRSCSFGKSRVVVFSILSLLAPLFVDLGISSTMPPRVKKTPARAAKSSRKKQIPPEEKIDEASVSVAEVKEEIKVVEEVVQQKENKLKPSKPQVESKSEPNGSLPAKG